MPEIQNTGRADLGDLVEIKKQIDAGFAAYGDGEIAGGHLLAILWAQFVHAHRVVPNDDPAQLALIMRPGLEGLMPAGFTMAPDFRGYANLGTGQYLINHSAEHEPAELIISVATEAEIAGRVVGDERDNAPGNTINPDVMAVRIRFSNVAGLDALESQLRYLREVHFAAMKGQP